MTRLRQAIILLLLLGTLVHCATDPQPDAEDFAVQEDTDSALAVALGASGRVDDVFTQVFLYTRIAEAYNEVGLLLPAANVLERATRVARREELGAARAEILVQVALRYRALDRIDRSRELLREALSLSREIEDEATRVVVLQEVINASFTAGEELFDVLVEALDQVYILGDLRARLGLLLDVARQYQESGLGRQVNVLLQQAISAAAAVDNPWDKASAYSGIARRFSVAGDGEQAELYVQRSLSEIEQIEVLTRSQAEAAQLLRISDNFAAIERFDEAERVLSTIEFAVLRARGLSELGSTYLEADRDEDAERVFDEAVNLVATEGADEQFADVVSDIAERLSRAGREDEALANAEVANFVATELEDSFTRGEILRRNARVFVNVDRLDFAVETVEEIADRGEAARIYITLAEELLDRGRAEDALNFVEPASIAAGEARSNTDAVFRDLSALYARIGRYDEAIEAIARISTAFAQSNALVELGRYSLLAGGLDGEETGRLSELAENLAGEPGRIPPLSSQ